MPAKTGSRNGLSYGWSLGENNWNTGMDENLTFIDRFGIHLSFKSFLNTPPGSPAAGDCHVVGSAPTGAWVGRAGQVAVYDDGAWRYGIPRTGWQAYCEADDGRYVFDGAWNLLAVGDISGLSGALAGKADLVGGVVPSSQLPSYVDDVIEVANFAALPATGEAGKIYVTLSDNNSWRWTGSTYQKVSQPLDEMPQAVAEAGASETLYAATARRIRQAIVAWWEAVKGSLSGPVAITANSASDALRVTQVGAGNALVIEDSASPDQSPIVFSGAGTMVIGGTVPRNIGVTPVFSLEGLGSSATTMLITRNSADTSPCTFRAVKSRGAANGAMDAIGSSDSILQFIAYGTDGTGHDQAASVILGADGPVSTGIVPGRIIFYTANSAGELTEVFRIDSSQVLALTSGKLKLALNAGATKLLQSDASGNASWGPAVGQADAALPTNTDIRAYYGTKFKPPIRPSLRIDWGNSLFEIYDAPTNTYHVFESWAAFAAHLGADLTLTRAGEQTYFDALGVMRTAAANTIQCDHDPLTGVPLGPYIGGARTNLLLNSETPATQSVTVTAQAYTLSFYGTGSIALSGAHTATVVGSGAYPVRTTLTFTPTAGALTVTPSGSVQKFQLEAGANPSPYILTAGAAATRPATVLSIGGTKFSGFYDQAKGSVSIKTRRLVTSPTFVYALVLSDGTSANYYSYRLGTGGADVLGVTSSVIQVNSADVQAGPIGLVAFGYATNDFSLSNNGLQTNLAQYAPPVVNRVNIGSWLTGGQQWENHITVVEYYPHKFANTSYPEMSK